MSGNREGFPAARPEVLMPGARTLWSLRREWGVELAGRRVSAVHSSAFGQRLPARAVK